MAPRLHPVKTRKRRVDQRDPREKGGGAREAIDILSGGGGGYPPSPTKFLSSELLKGITRNPAPIHVHGPVNSSACLQLDSTGRMSLFVGACSAARCHRSAPSRRGCMRGGKGGWGGREGVEIRDTIYLTSPLYRRAAMEGECDIGIVQSRRRRAMAGRVDEKAVLKTGGGGERGSVGNDERVGCK